MSDKSGSSTRNSRSESGSGSDTSTAMYRQEPFEAFQHRVLAFAQTAVWTDAAPNEIAVERLVGGGYNRIIGLLRQSQEETGTTTQYILRIPRFNRPRVGRDVAALRFVHENTKNPAPRIVVFDETTENALGSPYMVQHRLSGAPLHHCYPQLSTTERYRVATELGCIIRQMLAVRSSTTGRLVLPAHDDGPHTPLCIEPWYPTDSSLSTVPFSTSAASSSTCEALTTGLLAWKAEENRLRPWTDYKPNFIDKFLSIVRQMEELGYLAAIPFALAHLDFAPRNVLINATSHTAQPIISGVLDWDDAILGPMFMSCAPPSWIWQEWTDDDEDDEENGWDLKANVSPTTPEGRELQRFFEEAAGPDYMRFAYHPVYSIARRLMRFVVEGMKTSNHSREAEVMINLWDDVWRARANP